MEALKAFKKTGFVSKRAPELLLRCPQKVRHSFFLDAASTASATIAQGGARCYAS
jgi:hypothetical protein